MRTSRVHFALIMLACCSAAFAEEENLALRVQQELIANGYDVGGADGLWGAKSSSALSAFQADQGLQATGTWDSETSDSLGIPYAAPVSSSFDAEMAVVRNLLGEISYGSARDSFSFGGQLQVSTANPLVMMFGSLDTQRSLFPMESEEHGIYNVNAVLGSNLTVSGSSPSSDRASSAGLVQINPSESTLTITGGGFLFDGTVEKDGVVTHCSDGELVHNGRVARFAVGTICAVAEERARFNGYYWQLID